MVKAIKTIQLLALLFVADDAYLQTCDFVIIPDISNVKFKNISTVSNAHYFWNFGDGSGSNDKNPIHEFPDDGTYYVTLYALDTLNDNSFAKAYWLTYERISSDGCIPKMDYYYEDDTIYQNDYDIGFYLAIFDKSENCNYDIKKVDGGFFFNAGANDTMQFCCGYRPNIGRLELLRINYYNYNYDNDPGMEIYHSYYYTLPRFFDIATNYQTNSSNFEFITEYKDEFAEVTFTAMNTLADSCTFIITGEGSPIYLQSTSAKYSFDYNSNHKLSYNRIFCLTYFDGACDTTIQAISHKNPNYGFDPELEFNNLPYQFEIYPNPVSDYFTIDLDAGHLMSLSLEIYGSNGQFVRSYMVNGNYQQYDVNDLPSGIYFLRLFNRYNSLTAKLVKM